MAEETIKPEPEKTGEKQEKKKGPGRELTQFKPGQSGNPKGKPRGLKSISTQLKEALREYAKRKDGSPLIVDGKEQTWQDALIMRIIEKAIVRGDFKTINMLIDRLEGKPSQSIKFKDETLGKESIFEKVGQIHSILTHGQSTDKGEDRSEETV